MMNMNAGPAFPFGEKNDDGSHHHSHGGMSLRDWFAGQALIGLCQADMSEEEFTVSDGLLARTAYRMADAMLKAREA